MAREYPAAWPVSDGLADELPTIYFHMVGVAFPPANPDTKCPAGWAEVSDWEIECELDAPLLPGQIKADTKFITATAKCTVDLPEGAIVAPWRTGSERTPDGGKAELWASYNGPTGSTAMLLGQFVLDPMSGNTANPYLSVSFVQDTIRLQKPHSIPARKPSWPGVEAWGSHASIIQYGAVTNGFAFNIIGAFFVSIDFAYFPRKTEQLEAMQIGARTNLAAMFLSMDGSTIEVRGHDYLAGAGPIVETIDVGDQLDKLEWAQDPNAKVDRVEITYLPPQLDDAALGPAPFETASVWTAPKGIFIDPGGTYSFEFDPGHHIAPLAFADSFQIMSNEYSNGAGADAILPGTIVQRSSGNYVVSIYNPHTSRKHLMLPYDGPGALDRGWGVSKGTPSFIPGVADRASESDSSRTVAWGAAVDDATNVLTFSAGRHVQFDANAALLLSLVVARVQSSTYVVEDFRLPLDFRRELADLYRLRESEVGFDQRSIVTKLKLEGDRNEIKQTGSLAILPLQPGD